MGHKQILHDGHADILREQIDGQAGLRAPGQNLPPWDADRWAAHVDRLTAIAEDRAPDEA
ncbi:hypothetical protein [Micrococcus sp.]|uniref:hypothetical protein n=1 Tax=Micrococcus sp. TaxID=1271 RepID=UPI0026DC28AD|nr:hypothetical protein [Micrococcus sp.]MDO4239564.1 hypothetical protein [Micrococcus sp.]